MKEIWIEKLIELLNEWSKTAIKNKCNWTDVYDEDWIYFVNLFDRDMTMEMEDVISKRNWFIKWLVENDKIDKGEIPQIDGSYYNLYDDYDNLLMNLSIQDEPIRFLCEILK